MLDLPTVILVLRYLFSIGGAMLIAHGMATQSGLDEAMGIVPAVAPIVLGWLSHLQQKAAVKEAALTGVPKQAGLTSAVVPSKQAEAHAQAVS